MDGSVIQDRLTQLKAKRAARTERDGTPRKNYAKNVRAIDEEIEKLERKAAHGNATE